MLGLISLCIGSGLKKEFDAMSVVGCRATEYTSLRILNVNLMCFCDMYHVKCFMCVYVICNIIKLKQKQTK